MNADEAGSASQLLRDTVAAIERCRSPPPRTLSRWWRWLTTTLTLPIAHWCTPESAAVDTSPDENASAVFTAWCEWHGSSLVADTAAALTRYAHRLQPAQRELQPVLLCPTVSETRLLFLFLCLSATPLESTVADDALASALLLAAAAAVRSLVAHTSHLQEQRPPVHCGVADGPTAAYPPEKCDVSCEPGLKIIAQRVAARTRAAAEGSAMLAGALRRLESLEGSHHSLLLRHAGCAAASLITGDLAGLLYRSPAEPSVKTAATEGSTADVIVCPTSPLLLDFVCRQLETAAAGLRCGTDNATVGAGGDEEKPVTDLVPVALQILDTMLRDERALAAMAALGESGSDEVTVASAAADWTLPDSGVELAPTVAAALACGSIHCGEERTITEAFLVRAARAAAYPAHETGASQPFC